MRLHCGPYKTPKNHQPLRTVGPPRTAPLARLAVRPCLVIWPWVGPWCFTFHEGCLLYAHGTASGNMGSQGLPKVRVGVENLQKKTKKMENSSGMRWWREEGHEREREGKLRPPCHRVISTNSLFRAAQLCCQKNCFFYLVQLTQLK